MAVSGGGAKLESVEIIEPTALPPSQLVLTKRLQPLRFCPFQDMKPTKNITQP